MVYAILDIIHFILGFILLFMAFRSYLKTRISAMIYLILGFFFLTFGHLFVDIYFFHDLDMNKIFSEIFDILGLLALIIAVTKISD